MFSVGFGFLTGNVVRGWREVKVGDDLIPVWNCGGSVPGMKTGGAVPPWK